MLPVLVEPDAKDFNLCRTVNWIEVYGMTISKAGTFPRQKPWEKTKYKKNIKNREEQYSCNQPPNDTTDLKKVLRDGKCSKRQTRKPSSLKMSLVAWTIPVYLDAPDKFPRTTDHEVVGSSWTWMAQR